MPGGALEYVGDLVGEHVAKEALTHGSSSNHYAVIENLDVCALERESHG